MIVVFQNAAVASAVISLGVISIIATTNNVTFSNAFSLVTPTRSLFSSSSSLPYGVTTTKKKKNALFLYQNDESNNNNNDDDEEPTFFDDFDFVIGDDASSSSSSPPSSSSLSSSSSSLKDRLAQLMLVEERLETQISENYETGHWSVRGCSLDPGDNDNDTDNGVKVKVSSICAATIDDNNDNDSSSSSSNIDTAGQVVVVGRTDGSLIWLQLGGSQEYLAKFTNQLVAKDVPMMGTTMDDDNDNGSNNDSDDTKDNGDDDDDDGNKEGGSGLGMVIQQELQKEGNDSSSTSINNFEILSQLQAGNGAIRKMVLVQPSSSLFDSDDYGDDKMMLYFVDQSKPNQIQQLAVSEDGPEEGAAILSLREHDSSIIDVHAAPIVSLMTNTNDDEGDGGILVSADRDGKIVVWKTTGTATTTVLSKFEIPIGDALLSCDMDSNYMYFGDAAGVIHVYSTTEILSNDNIPEPLKSFPAIANGGISSICGAGPGSLGPGTMTVVAGSTMGDIIQWELIPRGGQSSVEFWPKLATQKLKGKAHVFDTTMTASYDETNNNAVLALRVVQDNVILSADTAGRLLFWDPRSGKSYFDMQGLEFGNDNDMDDTSDVSCVILAGASLMVTNGMEQYVCVHDFSIDPLDEDDIDDMIDTNMGED